MDRIWIVMGTTGEYSDRDEWPVFAFRSENAAKSYVSALSERMQQIPQEWVKDSWTFWTHREDIKRHMASLDPSFHMDYTGTSYFLHEVDIREEEPRAAAAPKVEE